LIGEPLVSKRQLTAEQWRVISYLYHPDQLSKRLSPSLAVVLDKQDVDRDAVIEVVERGLVQARVGGEECTRGPLKRLPETAIRLRLTKAGIYHVSHDPQHLVMCALRQSEFNLSGLLHLHKPVTFGELCEMADRNLLDTYLTHTDIEVPIRDVRDSPGLACARLTTRGRTFVAYL
jgi:hypothetical protein